MVFALDSSGSIKRDNFYVMQQFVQDIIYGLDIEGGARLGVMTFASDATVSGTFPAINILLHNG